MAIRGLYFNWNVNQVCIKASETLKIKIISINQHAREVKNNFKNKQ